jgi:hypothetical protein
MLKKNKEIFIFFMLFYEKNVLLPHQKRNLNLKKMKKVLSIIAVAAMTTAFVACGPSKEEMEKAEQLKQDSIAAVEKAKLDSIAAAAAEAEKMAMEANAARMADSARVADSVAAASKKGGKKH